MRDDDYGTHSSYFRPLQIMSPRNLLYAQSGGVTPVINASAAGVIQTARQHRRQIGKVLAGKNGIVGAALAPKAKL